MHVFTFVAALLCTVAVNAHMANPMLKRYATMPLGIAGRELSNNGLFKRVSCPSGQTACGSGCATGPCCDSSGLSCRDNEYCTTVDGTMACCANGYTCASVRTCENADSPGCKAGDINSGRFCCDASAPFCNTAVAQPYCQAYLTGVAYVSPASSTITVTGDSTVTAGTATPTITPVVTAVGATVSTTATKTLTAAELTSTSTSKSASPSPADTSAHSAPTYAVHYSTWYAATLSSYSDFSGTTTVQMGTAFSIQTATFIQYNPPSVGSITVTEYGPVVIVGGTSPPPTATPTSSAVPVGVGSNSTSGNTTMSSSLTSPSPTSFQSDANQVVGKLAWLIGIATLLLVLA